LMVDLDHFKSINDRFGHPMGDRVIQTAATLLVSWIREGDVACRIGGEECALLLVETPLQAAHTVAERLRVRLSPVDLSHEGRVVRVPASFGLTSTSCFEGAACTAEALVSAADEALYEAKGAGRDCVRL